MCFRNNIVFLGFGFHPQNIELLRPTNVSGTKFVYGTAIGISGSANIAVSNQLSAALKATEVRLEDKTCYQLLDEYSLTPKDHKSILN